MFLCEPLNLDGLPRCASISDDPIKVSKPNDFRIDVTARTNPEAQFNLPPKINPKTLIPYSRELAII